MKLDKNLINHIRDIYERRHTPEARHEYADLYWRGLLLFTAVSVALLLLYSAGLLIDILYRLDTDTGQVQKATSSLLDQTQLQNTIDTFTARQTNFNDFKNATTTPIGDPS